MIVYRTCEIARARCVGTGLNHQPGSGWCKGPATHRLNARAPPVRIQVRSSPPTDPPLGHLLAGMSAIPSDFSLTTRQPQARARTECLSNIPCAPFAGACARTRMERGGSPRMRERTVQRHAFLRVPSARPHVSSAPQCSVEVRTPRPGPGAPHHPRDACVHSLTGQVIPGQVILDNISQNFLASNKLYGFT